MMEVSWTMVQRLLKRVERNGGFHGVRQSSVLQTEILALPVSNHEVVNPEFPAATDLQFIGDLKRRPTVQKNANRYSRV